MLVQGAIRTLKLLAWSMCLLTWSGALLNAAAAGTIQLGKCQAYWLQLKPEAFNAGFPLKSTCRYKLMERWDSDQENSIVTHTSGKFPRRDDTPKDDKKPLEDSNPAFTTCYLIERDTLCPHGEAKNDNYFQLSAPPGHDSTQKYGLFCMYIQNLLTKPTLAPNNAWPGWTLDWEDQNDKHNQCKLNYKYTAPTNAAWLTFYPPSHKAVRGDLCPYQLQSARLDSRGVPARGSNALSGTNSVWYCRYILADPRCSPNHLRPYNLFQVTGPANLRNLGIFCPLKGDARPPPQDAYAQLGSFESHRPTWHYDVSTTSWLQSATSPV
ncbi:hypothetical protein BCR37DRAFT_166355 [Protomyces lactucae-debilis]|uniref:Uncharacterized protein n=1 Tax=Protomyces lactucae-debilis TaxID=2754530 RepID=A0A1Y2EXQ1_PROLT|nr:uncharacterized protein BCR37DRAFT_166355 [Protomyces lactucae-debilis]ORY76392.1 hypothetical protein BCR37DRAFT_166355 [Protomyces lactucae-debilis]